MQAPINHSPNRRPRSCSTNKRSFVKPYMVGLTVPLATKKVAFATENDKIHIVPNFQEVRSVVWFTPEETADSKADATQLAEALEALGRTKENEEWRGLESRGPEGKWKAYKTRMDVVNAVLDAQDLRRDPLSLAKVSREMSADCMIDALERARGDEVCAKIFCKGSIQTISKKPKTRSPRSTIQQNTQAVTKTKNTKSTKKTHLSRHASVQHAPWVHKIVAPESPRKDRGERVSRMALRVGQRA